VHVIRTLLAKELRSLVPIAALVLLLHGSDLLVAPLMERLDERPWATREETAGEAETTAAVVLMGLALLVAYSLFPREHDDGTIRFLLALPVTRRAVFAAKVLAGFGVLAAGVACSSAAAWLLCLPNHQSFTGEQFRTGVALGTAFLYAAYSGIVMCHGVLLSFFRRFGLLAYAIAAWAIHGAKSIDPAAAILDPTRLVRIEIVCRSLVVPWRDLAVHGAIAAVALLAAYVLWTGPAERATEAFARFAGRLSGRVLLGLAAFGLVVAIVATLERVFGDAPQRVRYESFEAARIDTVHYRFTYPIGQRGAALDLVRAADGIHEAVRRALDAPGGAEGAVAPSGRIPGGAEGAVAPSGLASANRKFVVDLTERGREHLGLAAWQKIRIDISREPLRHWFKHALVHETVHAFELAVSSRRIQENAVATGIFDEGLAEYLAFRLSGDGPERLVASRRLAAAACERARIRPDELLDMKVFRTRHDPELVYPVGETWVAALCRAYGAAAPGRLLRAMDRPGAPQRLAPRAFWADTLRAAGFDLEQTNRTWQGLVREAAAVERAYLDRIPRLSGGVLGRSGDDVTLSARADRPVPPGARCLARLRSPGADEDDRNDVVAGTPERQAGGRVWLFRVDSDRLVDQRFEFQLGIEMPGMDRPYFEEWQTALVP
jgi:hypothetical protein